LSGWIAKQIAKHDAPYTRVSWGSKLCGETFGYNVKACPASNDSGAGAALRPVDQRLGKETGYAAIVLVAAAAATAAAAVAAAYRRENHGAIEHPLQSPHGKRGKTRQPWQGKATTREDQHQMTEQRFLCPPEEYA